MKVIKKNIDKHECIMSDAIIYKGRKIELALREKDMLLSVWITDLDFGEQWVSCVNVRNTKNMVTYKPGDNYLRLNLKKRQTYLYHAHNLINIAKKVIDAIVTANDIKKSYQ